MAPDPRLVKHGLYDEPKQIVAKVRAITDAHERKFGFRPTPGHVYDVVRANVPVEEIPALYDALPRSRRHARIRSIPVPSPDTMDAEFGVPEFDEDARVVREVREAAASDEWDSWVAANASVLKTADKGLKQRIALAKNRGDIDRAKASLQAGAVKRGHIIPATPTNIAIVQKAGLDPTRAFGPSWEAFNNIVSALAFGPPILAFLEGKAIYETAKDPIKNIQRLASGKQQEIPLVKTNVDLAIDVGKGFAQDVTHPRENFEYLVLDAFGLSSLLRGGVARGSAAARAKGVRAKAKALATKPAPGTREAVFGDPDSPYGQLAVDLLNSENPLVADLQKALTTRANRTRQKRDAYDPTDAPSKLREWRERFASQEARAKGRLAADRRNEQAVARMTRDDLQRVTSQIRTYGFIRERLPARIRRGMTKAEDAVLYVLSLDEPGGFDAKLKIARDFHERQIVLGLGDPEDHAAKLALFQMAEKAHRSPSKALREALQVVPRAIGEREEILLGLGQSEEALARRVAQHADVLRGDPVSRNSALSELHFLKRNLREGNADAEAIAVRIAEIRAKFADLPSDIGGERAKLAALTQRRVTAAEAGDDAALARLDKQIATATEEIARSQRVLSELAPLTDASFYFPLRVASKKPLASKASSRGVRLSPAGVPPRDPTRELGLKYRFTGSSLTMGEYRMDTARLVGEELGKAQRSLGLLHEYTGLLKASTKTQRSSWDVPIRTPGNAKIPDQLREILGREPGAITADEAKVLSTQDWDAFVKSAYGAEFDRRTGKYTFDTKAEGGEFRWVDRRLLGADAFLAPTPGVVKAGAQAINSPVRFVTLYARLAYLTNAIGAAGATLWFQNIFAPQNLYRAIMAKRRYGKEFSEFSKEQVGGGRYVSYAEATETLGKLGATERKVAHFWNAVTDERLRMSAFIHRLRKAGFDESEYNDLAKGYRSGSLEPDAKKRVDEAIVRAKKDSVEFDNLSWFEKENLRQLIFIYPWQSRSVVWNLRAVAERPAQSAVLAQVGRDALEDMEEEGGPEVREWLEKRGYMPLFWNNGVPTVVNAMGVNSLGSMHQMFSNATDKNFYQSLAGPFSDFIVGAVTGKDRFGRDYERQGALWNLYSAFLESVTSLPQVAAGERQEKFEGQPGLPGVDVADRATLVKRLNAALKQVALTPGWSAKLAGIEVAGTLISGAPFTPRELNVMKVRANAYRNLPPEEKLRAEKDLIGLALGIQADALGRSVPPEVRSAVEDAFDVEKHVAAKTRETGISNTLTDINWALDLLVDKGLVSAEQAKKDRAYAMDQADANRDEIMGEILRKYVDPAGRLAQWDSDVSALARASSPQDLPFYVKRLNAEGVGDYSSPQGLTTDELRAYGRKVAEYNRRADDLARIATDTDAPSGDREQAERALRVLQDEFSEDVVVAGRKLPSPVRLEWALDDDEDRQETLARSSVQPWETLSAFEKELLGRKPAPNTAWAFYEAARSQYLASQPPGKRRGFERLDVAAARHTNKSYPGFLSDWEFGRQPLARRLGYFKPIQQSPARPVWDEILKKATGVAAYLKDENYTASRVRDQWRDYVTKNLMPWAQAQPGFQAELDRYGMDILYRLLD